MNIYPIIDLHCDLLSYLAEALGSTPFDTDNIGCAVPYLKQGKVKLQVLAAYSSTSNGSAAFGEKQVGIFQKLGTDTNQDLEFVSGYNEIINVLNSAKVGVIGAIENASCFCEEDEPLDAGLERLEKMINGFGKILYIGFTHMPENRFGGGNLSDVGLKDDGKTLLEYLDGRKIAVDFSHMSDALANDTLNYIDKKELQISILASHSNFRSIYAHKAKRNLPDEIAKEICSRKGIIGINFIKDFIGENPQKLMEHIMYGFAQGFEDNLSFGADFFSASNIHQSDTGIFFYDQHANAGKYPLIMDELKGIISESQMAKLSHLNALNFIKTVW